MYPLDLLQVDLLASGASDPTKDFWKVYASLYVLCLLYTSDAADE